ncbi:MAG TPA: hypothetical protein VHV49_05940 [Pseudonocardiaceae bacterium]|jgi:hypothetical protein|nr:hypothetical protein [Pseudonocardiaceae bacterium]
MAGSVTRPNGDFLDLPPNVGRRVRGAGGAMGAGQTFAGIVIAALSGGLAAGQHSLGDPLWVINLVGVVPPLLVVALGVGLFRARGCVSGDRLLLAKAGRVRAGLRGVWLAIVVTAVLIIVALAVGLSIASKDSAVAGNLSLLDGAAFAIPVVTAVVGSVGFLVGRNLLPPPPDVLAKAWSAVR